MGEDFSFKRWLNTVAGGNMAEAARIIGCSRMAVKHWRDGTRGISTERKRQIIKAGQRELRKLAELYKENRNNSRG